MSDRPSEEEIGRVRNWECAERERKSREYRAERDRVEAEEAARWESEINDLLIGRRVVEWNVFLSEFFLAFDDGTAVQLEWDEDEHGWSVSRVEKYETSVFQPEGWHWRPICRDETKAKSSPAGGDSE